MAYSGFLIKIGNYTFPLKYILQSSPNPVKVIMDQDSYRDANGYIHRETLEHWVAKVSFDVVPYLTGVEFAALMNNISSNYTLAKQRKANVTVFVPEINDYVTQEMYIPDIEATIYDADSSGNIIYNSFGLEFIGY